MPFSKAISEATGKRVLAIDRVQRSGYPDLRLVENATNRVFNLDPKHYATGSRDSGFRTFTSSRRSRTKCATTPGILLGFRRPCPFQSPP
jgi:hypothetical protein